MSFDNEPLYATRDRLDELLKKNATVPSADWKAIGRNRLNELLREELEVSLGLLFKEGYRAKITSAEPSEVLLEGVDALSGAKTFLAHDDLVQHGVGERHMTRTVYIVYSEPVGVQKGMFFITKTLAEVHFANITGQNKVQDTENSGGRTLSEMIQYLFLS